MEFNGKTGVGALNFVVNCMSCFVSMISIIDLENTDVKY